MMKKTKKVEVDKDFLASVLRTQTEMKDEIKKLKDVKTQPIPLNPLPQTVSQGVFWCVAIDTFGANNREEFNKNFKQFERALEILMRQYRLVSLQANLFQQI